MNVAYAGKTGHYSVAVPPDRENLLACVPKRESEDSLRTIPFQIVGKKRLTKVNMGYMAFQTRRGR